MTAPVRSHEKRSALKCSVAKIEKKEFLIMEPKDYTVVKIEGEYAYLHADGEPPENDVFIAMALLPPGVDIGSRIHCEMLCYTLIE